MDINVRKLCLFVIRLLCNIPLKFLASCLTMLLFGVRCGPILKVGHQVIDKRWAFLAGVLLGLRRPTNGQEVIFLLASYDLISVSIQFYYSENH